MKLREMTENDLDRVLEWRNSPQVRRNMYTSHEISILEHKNWFEKIKNNENNLWYIFVNDDGVDEGVVYFTNYEPNGLQVFWGFYSSPTASKGVGTRMEYSALEHAFSVLEVHKLNCEVFSTNMSVVNLHKKSGFSEEGRFRDYYFNGDHYVDVIRLGILKHEWDESKNIVIEKIKKYC